MSKAPSATVNAAQSVGSAPTAADYELLTEIQERSNGQRIKLDALTSRLATAQNVDGLAGEAWKEDGKRVLRLLNEAKNKSNNIILTMVAHGLYSRSVSQNSASVATIALSTDRLDPYNLIPTLKDHAALLTKTTVDKLPSQAVTAIRDAITAAINGPDFKADLEALKGDDLFSDIDTQLQALTKDLNSLLELATTTPPTNGGQV